MNLTLKILVFLSTRSQNFSELTGDMAYKIIKHIGVSTDKMSDLISGLPTGYIRFKAVHRIVYLRAKEQYDCTFIHSSTFPEERRSERWQATPRI